MQTYKPVWDEVVVKLELPCTPRNLSCMPICLVGPPKCVLKICLGYVKMHGFHDNP